MNDIFKWGAEFFEEVEGNEYAQRANLARARVIRKMYNAYCLAGFTPSEAFELVKQESKDVKYEAQ